MRLRDTREGNDGASKRRKSEGTQQSKEAEDTTGAEDTFHDYLQWRRWRKRERAKWLKGAIESGVGAQVVAVLQGRAWFPSFEERMRGYWSDAKETAQRYPDLGVERGGKKKDPIPPEVR